MNDSYPVWLNVSGCTLRQGDLIQDCLVPSFEPDYGTCEHQTYNVPVESYDCIIITQSCDLENNKAPLVALCPIYALNIWEQQDEFFKKKGSWEKVRQGRIEGLHMISSPSRPEDNKESLVANFREIYSLPVGYLSNQADGAKSRWRLNSPYLEHFSQAFARFFMRVGLRSAIPKFN